MSKPYTLKIITPTEVGFEAQVEHVRLPGLDGDFGVLAGHAPLLSAVRVGLLHLRRPDKAEQVYAVGEGFVEVFQNEVVLITDFADESTNIDVERAKESMRRARERLKDRYDQDVERAEASVARARIRLIASGHMDHEFE